VQTSRMSTTRSASCFPLPPSRRARTRRSRSSATRSGR
jgi:hypothetical protein